MLWISKLIIRFIKPKSLIHVAADNTSIKVFSLIKQKKVLENYKKKAIFSIISLKNNEKHKVICTTHLQCYKIPSNWATSGNRALFRT